MYDEPPDDSRYEDDEATDERELMILDVAASVLPVLINKYINLTAKELARDAFKYAEELIKEHERRLESK
jgi:hypothetical protein